MKITSICFSLTLASLFLLGMAGNAYAYLDAGTASYVLSAIVAVITGGAVFLKVYWGKLMGMLGRGTDEDK